MNHREAWAEALRRFGKGEKETRVRCALNYCSSCVGMEEIPPEDVEWEIGNIQFDLIRMHAPVSTMTIPPMPDVIREEDWLLMKEVVGLEAVKARGFSTIHENEEHWIDYWSGQPGMIDGWFESPKGIFVVHRPHFAAIDRLRLESLCKTQEVFSRVCPVVMYLMWRVVKSIARKCHPPT